MKYFIFLSPLFVMTLGYIHHRQTRHIAEVRTVSDCVTQQWQIWEYHHGTLPTQEEEAMLREECWAHMGATLN